MITYQILLIVTCLNLVHLQHRKTIRTTQYGPVRGKVAYSRTNSYTAYYSFQGIQFARPPIGKLRFKEPQPPSKWNHIKDARQHKQVCVQLVDSTFIQRTDITGSEDCLYLDVYIPITLIAGTKKLCPFTCDGVDSRRQPVVIVEVEFRLSVFGFFTTLDDNAKGNIGMKDQVLALKWVQRNIQYFDGDPSRVTIFGASIGGAAIFYHMVSPLSKGLFMQGISESGTPLNTWGFQRNPLEKTYLLAKHFGITSNDSKVIVRELQKVDADDLCRAAFNFSVVGYFTPADAPPFAGIIERDSDTAFVSESVYNSLEKGDFQKIPLMMGVVQQEAAPLWAYILRGGLDVNVYQREPQLLIPETLNIPPGHPCINKTLRAITQQYFPDGNYTGNIERLINYLSLRIFIIGIMETGRFLYDSMPVRFYQFTYVDSRTNGYFGYSGHLDELFILFYPQGVGANPNATAADILTRNRMITLWTNFAITGNPTPRPEELLENVIWPTVNASQNYLNFGNHLTVQSPLPYTSDMEFWNRQYQECGFHDPNPNFDTY